MDTSEIRYRVADFLKQHPPFNAVDDSDLVALAAHGRVRFFPSNEFLAWQGEPHKAHVLVIQQGTVSLWDETNGRPVLRDVRGPGDLLGIERFYGAPQCVYSARSVSDVVIYSFPASDFEDLVLAYPYARQFVEAHDSVSADFEWARGARSPHEMFLHDIVGRKPLETCRAVGHLALGDLWTLVRLGMRAHPHRPALYRGGERAQIALESIQLEDERRRVDVLDAVAYFGRTTGHLYSIGARMVIARF